MKNTAVMTCPDFQTLTNCIDGLWKDQMARKMRNVLFSMIVDHLCHSTDINERLTHGGLRCLPYLDWKFDIVEELSWSKNDLEDLKIWRICEFQSQLHISILSTMHTILHHDIYINSTSIELGQLCNQ